MPNLGERRASSDNQMESTSFSYKVVAEIKDSKEELESIDKHSNLFERQSQRLKLIQQLIEKRSELHSMDEKLHNIMIHHLRLLNNSDSSNLSSQEMFKFHEQNQELDSTSSHAIDLSLFKPRRKSHRSDSLTNNSTCSSSSGSEIAGNVFVRDSDQIVDKFEQKTQTVNLKKSRLLMAVNHVQSNSNVDSDKISQLESSSIHKSAESKEENFHSSPSHFSPINRAEEFGHKMFIINTASIPASASLDNYQSNLSGYANIEHELGSMQNRNVIPNLGLEANMMNSYANSARLFESNSQFANLQNQHHIMNVQSQYNSNFISHNQVHNSNLGKRHHLVAMNQFAKVAFKCHVCGSGFEDRHRLQQHLSIHLNLDPSWYEEQTIRETMAQYESKRGDYLCVSCKLRFDTTAEFDKHMQLHGEKPHRCDLCCQENKIVSFRYYRQLLTHLRSHCFLFTCRFAPECKQTANRKDYLKLHILKHHLRNKLPEQYTICCQ